MSEYSIEVVQEEQAVSFVFSSESGPVRAVSIAVVEPSKEQFLWVLHSATSKDLLQTEMDPVLEQRAHAMAERAAPADLRLFAAKLFGSTANRVIERITYGDVPAGFVQGYPTGAPPEALRPGVAYALCLWGSHGGTQSFEIRSPAGAAERADEADGASRRPRRKRRR